MKLAPISTVFALGALAACGGVPDETRVASYGDAVPPSVSQPATSTDEPAQESASAAIAEARAAASAQANGEKPGPGALAFSPAQGDQAARADVPAPEHQNAQVAALSEPATEKVAAPPKQDEESAAAETEVPAEPTAEDLAALPKQDEESSAAETEAPAEPTSEAIATLPKQDTQPAAAETEAPAEPTSEEIAALPKQAAETPGQSYGVQLAAYRQASGAEAVWNGLLRAHPDLLGELSKTIRRADLGATRGVVHQLRVGPFAGEAEARTLCETLKKRGTDCFVVAPRRSGRP